MGALSKSEFKKTSVLLATMLLSGLLFRLYNLGGESLWLDEALSVKYAGLNLSQIFFLHDTSPPLYYLLLHWWIHAFGNSEVSVRIPSVICGFFSIIAVYKIGKELFDTNTGMLSALLMTVSVCHVQYSQEARTYSLSVLLTLLSMYYFISLLSAVNGKTVTGYILSSILLVYSHIYGIFIIMAQNVYFVVLSLLSRERTGIHARKWFSIQVLFLLLLAPWIGVLLHEVAHVQKGFWIPRPHLSTVIFSFKTYSSGSWILLILFLAMLPLSFISYKRIRSGMAGENLFKVMESFQWKIHFSNIDRGCFLLMWLMFPVVLPFIISRISQPIYVARYSIVASPALFLLVAGGVNNMHARIVRSAIVSMVVAISLAQMGAYYSRVNKGQWRDVAGYVGAHANRNDVILVSPSYYMDPFNYYDRNVMPVKKGFPSDGRKVVDDQDIARLRNIVVNRSRIWLILAECGDKEEKIAGALGKSYNLSLYKEYRHINLYLFDKKAGRIASRLPTPSRTANDKGG